MNAVANTERLLRRVDAIVAVLKERFPNLTTDETLQLAGKILLRLEGTE